MLSYFKKSNWAGKIILAWCFLTTPTLFLGMLIAIIFGWQYMFHVGAALAFIGFIPMSFVWLHAVFPIE